MTRALGRRHLATATLLLTIAPLCGACRDSPRASVEPTHAGEDEPIVTEPVKTPAPKQEVQKAPTLAERLRERVATVCDEQCAAAEGEQAAAAWAEVKRFYEQRDHRPAWTGDAAALHQAEALIEQLADARAHGLEPKDYRVRELQRELDQLHRRTRASLDEKVELEVLLTHGFMDYASDLLYGRIDPSLMDTPWELDQREGDLVAALERALAETSIERELRRLDPPHDEYRALREARAEFVEQLERHEAWDPVPEGAVLSRGDKAPRSRIEALEARLRAGRYLEDEGLLSRFGLGENGGEASADASADGSARAVYDERLARAVEAFQRRHGIEVDGVVGPSTLRTMNVTPEERLRQIDVNLERWRWIPAELGEPHIEVNIPAYALDLVGDPRGELEMKVIAGQRDWATPVFSDRMTHLVFNPYWNVPRSIAVEDLLPKIKEDPNYLVDRKFEVYPDWESIPDDRIDPSTIDWETIDEENFSFVLRRGPGPGNPLGRVKFMFPNHFNIYLHDTPSDHLFARADRGFSHGCVRVSKPAELATRLLDGKEEWNRSRVLEAMASDQNQTVQLASPMSVHLFYWTAFVDEDGVLKFRDDIYGADETLARLLDRR